VLSVTARTQLVFFDRLIVYDLSSSRRWTGMIADMENTNGYARNKENAFLVVSGPDDTAFGGVFWIGNSGGGCAEGCSGIG
jgi:hypothetical protein